MFLHERIYEVDFIKWFNGLLSTTVDALILILRKDILNLYNKTPLKKELCKPLTEPSVKL
jgi:hypothetical protein